MKSRQNLAPLRPSLNNRELNEILREYNAPAAPATFNPARRQSRCRPFPWWRWLLTGTIRIPVPALLAITLAAIFLLTRKPNPQPNDLSKFQAVKQLNVRIIRSNYESH